jgi:hypothetical protein
MDIISDRDSKIFYTETFGGFEYFYPCPKKQGTHFRVPEESAIEKRAEFARRGFRLVPIGCTIELLG